LPALWPGRGSAGTHARRGWHAGSPGVSDGVPRRRDHSRPAPQSAPIEAPAGARSRSKTAVSDAGSINSRRGGGRPSLAHVDPGAARRMARAARQGLRQGSHHRWPVVLIDNTLGASCGPDPREWALASLGGPGNIGGHDTAPTAAGSRSSPPFPCLPASRSSLPCPAARPPAQGRGQGRFHRPGWGSSAKGREQTSRPSRGLLPGNSYSDCGRSQNTSRLIAQRSAEEQGSRTPSRYVSRRECRILLAGSSAAALLSGSTVAASSPARASPGRRAASRTWRPTLVKARRGRPERAAPSAVSTQLSTAAVREPAVRA
jgi:hypothetical protein